MFNPENIKTGDVLLTRTRFKWNKISTYLSRLINFGTNFWSGILGKPYSPCNHSGIFIWVQGTLYIFESVDEGFVRKLAPIYMSKLTKDNYWIKRYDNINEFWCFHNAVIIEGMKYNYLKLFKEVANQLTNEQFETVRKRPWKRAVCSQAVAYIINSCNKEYCDNPNNFDPQDLYMDTNSRFLLDVY